MDLIEYYIIIFILLYSITISLIIRQLKWSKYKIFEFISIHSIIICTLTILSKLILIYSEYIIIIPYIYGFITLLTIIFTLFYFIKYKKDNNEKFYITIKIFNKKIILFNKHRIFYNYLIILIGMIISQYILIIFSSIFLKVNNIIFSSVKFGIISFIVLILVYKISKILLKSKRYYPEVVGEFLILKVILLTILSLTFITVRTLDYSIFSPYLILTPNYQIMYTLVLIGIIIVCGILLNDKYLKKLKRE